MQWWLITATVRMGNVRNHEVGDDKWWLWRWYHHGYDLVVLGCWWPAIVVMSKVVCYEVLSTKNAPFVIFYSGRYLLKTRKNLCKCSRVSGTCDRRELVIFARVVRLSLGFLRLSTSTRTYPHNFNSPMIFDKIRRGFQHCPPRAENPVPTLGLLV